MGTFKSSSHLFFLKPLLQYFNNRFPSFVDFDFGTTSFEGYLWAQRSQRVRVTIFAPLSVLYLKCRKPFFHFLGQRLIQS